MEKIEYLSIAPIETAAFQLVCSVVTISDPVTNNPQTMIFNVAMDRNKAQSDRVDFAVYVPAKGNYLEYDHHRMYQLFATEHQEFVAVNFVNFRIFRKGKKGNYTYRGYADSFRVIEHPEQLLEPELLL